MYATWGERYSEGIGDVIIIWEESYYIMYM